MSELEISIKTNFKTKIDLKKLLRKLFFYGLSGMSLLQLSVGLKPLLIQANSVQVSAPGAVTTAPENAKLPSKH